MSRLLNDGILGEFAESMLELANGMTREERKKYREEGLYEKLAEFQDEGKYDSINMEEFKDIFVVFDGDGNMDGKDDEAEEEDED